MDTPVRIGWNLAIAEQIVFCSRFEHLINSSCLFAQASLCAVGVFRDRSADGRVVVPPSYRAIRLSDRCNCYLAHSGTSTLHQVRCLTRVFGSRNNDGMNLSDSWATRRPVASRVSAAEAVLADLRAAITSGELAVGERLPSEASLAERHGVSRSVIREALRSCHALGLTETKSGLGTFVVSDSIARDLDFGSYAANELVEARPHVEIPAAGWAAQRHTAEELAALRGLVQQMRDEDDPLVWVALDAQFHGLIAKASRNRVFESVIVDIREALTRQSETLNLVAGRQEKSNEEHERIVEGIASGSYDHASRAMAEHLDAVRMTLETLVQESDSL